MGLAHGPDSGRGLCPTQGDPQGALLEAGPGVGVGRGSGATAPPGRIGRRYWVPPGGVWPGGLVFIE